MTTFWQRNRRRFLTAAAVGAAGAAAYYAYRWWYLDEEHLDGDDSERRDARGGARSQEQLDRDALEQHFASIQSIPEQKTMPTLLPSLSGALMRAADTAPLKEQLRRMKAERNPDSNAERVERWTELAEATFALAASTAWALPMLDLLLRVQINVLGRHLYFASLRTHNSADTTPLPSEAPLSTNEQHQFLGYADTLASQGVPQLVAAMCAAVHSVLQGLQLSQPVSAQMAMSLLADIHREFEAAASAGGWQPFLLPGSDEHTSPRVAAMLAEVRHVVSGPTFDTALRAAVSQAAQALAQALATSIGPGEGLPLARVVPAAESAAAALLAGPDNAVVAAIGRLPVVYELCAAAYANIPAVDTGAVP